MPHPLIHSSLLHNWIKTLGVSSHAGSHSKVRKEDGSENIHVQGWIDWCGGSMTFGLATVHAESFWSCAKQGSHTQSTCPWCLASSYAVFLADS